MLVKYTMLSTIPPRPSQQVNPRTTQFPLRISKLAN